jgi:hypothetical protein
VIASTLHNVILYGNSDPDVQAFLAVTGITDPTIKRALSILVADLKSNNLWSLCEVIYPIVGGTDDTHKYNLKNPQNTNAANRLSYTGGRTSDALGLQGNGTTGWADTFYSIPRQNDLHMSVYINNNTTGKCIIGALATTTSPFTQLYPRGDGTSIASNTCEADINQSASSTSAATVTNSQGMYIVTRTASNVIKTFLRGSVLINATTASTGITNRTLALMGRKTATVAEFSAFRMAYVSFGRGLTDSQSTLYTSLINKYESNLNRA